LKIVGIIEKIFLPLITLKAITTKGTKVNHKEHKGTKKSPSRNGLSFLPLPVSPGRRVPIAIGRGKRSMQQRHISHFLERLTISILSLHIPYIYTLRTKLVMVISVPRNVDIVTFKYQYAKPVEDLKLIFKHFLIYRREEELVNLNT
jgi:hypothetical protein